MLLLVRVNHSHPKIAAKIAGDPVRIEPFYVNVGAIQHDSEGEWLCLQPPVVVHTCRTHPQGSIYTWAIVLADYDFIGEAT